jgi:hypothetical protein
MRKEWPAIIHGGKRNSDTYIPLYPFSARFRNHLQMRSSQHGRSLPQALPISDEKNIMQTPIEPP